MELTARLATNLSRLRQARADLAVMQPVPGSNIAEALVNVDAALADLTELREALIAARPERVSAMAGG